jgi:hypothetical protein
LARFPWPGARLASVAKESVLSKSEAPVQNKEQLWDQTGELTVMHLGGLHAGPNTLSLQLWPGRWDGRGTLSGTDKNSKSLVFTGLGTVGRLYTPKAPPSPMQDPLTGAALRFVYPLPNLNPESTPTYAYLHPSTPELSFASVGPKLLRVSTVQRISKQFKDFQRNSNQKTGPIARGSPAVARRKATEGYGRSRKPAEGSKPAVALVQFSSGSGSTSAP